MAKGSRRQKAGAGGGLRSRVSPEKQVFAKKLRKSPSRAFEILWSVLRGNQLGVRVRRRAILLGWIPDFWCPARRVAIEIDYPSDGERVAQHARRDDVLLRHGITVMRILVDRVFHELPKVKAELKARLAGPSP
jgi:very-short-patch-repair endonuclease